MGELFPMDFSTSNIGFSLIPIGKDAIPIGSHGHHRKPSVGVHSNFPSKTAEDTGGKFIAGALPTLSPFHLEKSLGTGFAATCSVGNEA